MITKIHIKHLTEATVHVTNEVAGIHYINKFFGYINGVEKITDLSEEQIKRLKKQVTKFCTTKTPDDPVIEIERNVSPHKVATDIIAYILDCTDSEAAIISISNQLFS